MKKKLHLNFWTVITMALVALFAVFLIYPLVSLFISAFQNSASGSFTLEHFQKFFQRSYYMRALGNSLKIALCVTALCLVLGSPMAYIMTFYKMKGKKLIDILIVISMLSPPFIGAYSWILMLGRSGFVTKAFQAIGITLPTIYGMGGIIFVMTLKLYPFVYMYLCGALKKMDASLLEASESMGCRPFKRLWNMVLPLIMPTLLASALMIFMNAMADFGTPQLIGEGVQTMTTLIYKEYIGEVTGNGNFAAALAAIMALVTAALFLIQRYYVNRKSYSTTSIRPIEPKLLTGWKKGAAYTLIGALVFLSCLPHLVVVYTSLFKSDGSMYKAGFTLENYQKIFFSLSKPIMNTYLYGLIAIVLIVLLSMLVAYTSTRKRNFFTRLIDIITMFPYILPGAVLGITLLLAFNHGPIVLIGTPYIIILAFVIRRMPYTLRSSTAILYQIPTSVEEASISLGCPPVRTFFKITARLMLPGVFSGAVLSWVTVINELSASMLLYTGRTATMSVTVYSQILRTNYGSAAALSTVLTLSTILSLLLFFKVSGSTDVSV